MNVSFFADTKEFAMSDSIPPVSQSRIASALPPVGRTSYAQPTRSTPGRGSDSVEFSRTAQLLSKLAELPDVRQGLIDRVKGEIAAGTYETPEKIEAAVNGLLGDANESSESGQG
jgi:anti-sigma28 factor (negative regulator of flagellin synthesis)